MTVRPVLYKRLFKLAAEIGRSRHSVGGHMQMTYSVFWRHWLVLVSTQMIFEGL
jgi:hypothetical protein